LQVQGGNVHELPLPIEADFGVIRRLTVPGDAAFTTQNLLNSAPLFRLGAVGLVVVAILDVVVAWALYMVFHIVNPCVSQLGAWFRIVYAAIFASAITGLFGALRAAPAEPAQALFLLTTFDQGWHIGLIAFGLHLAVVCTLVWRADLFSRIVSSSWRSRLSDTWWTVSASCWIRPIRWVFRESRSSAKWSSSSGC
jgi:hypothetical protein